MSWTHVRNMCNTWSQEAWYFSHRWHHKERFKENIIADINKHEKTLDSLHLDSRENESLQVFNVALSAIEKYENMICDEVRKYSSKLKDEVEEQKKNFEGKTKITYSLKEKIEKELREGIEKDKSILQSNHATNILNYHWSLFCNFSVHYPIKGIRYSQTGNKFLKSSQRHS